MLTKIGSFFLSVIMLFLSVFGISFKHNEYGVINTVYSDLSCAGGNKNTDELKEIFAQVKAAQPQYTVCESKKPFADDDRISAVFYDGEEYNSKASQIFAYIGFPENADKNAPVPAMVLVHGGMGHACAEWTRYWVDHGYAAISIDGFGQQPADGEYTGDESADGWSLNPQSHMTIDEFRSADKPVKEQWFYYYISDIIRANSIMRADERIKTDSIGLTGISWGGFASSVTVCYDDRFAFAAPVYGCGFLDKGSGAFSGFTSVPEVFETWEPSLLLNEVKIPVMWFCGDDDPFFSADAVTNSAASTENGGLTFIPSYPHGQNPGAAIPEIVRFADEQNGKGNGNIEITDVSFKGGRAVLTVDIPEDVRSVSVYAYTRKTGLEYDGLNIKEKWKSTKGILLGDTANVRIPQDSEMVYFEAVGKTGSIFDPVELHASTGIFTKDQIAALNADVPRIDADKLSKLLTDTVNSDISEGKVGCAEILVNQLGERIFDGVFGIRDSEGNPLKKNDVYRIASMTKPITAFALLMEHDRGHLSIYDDVSKYLDGYENMKIGKLENDEIVITGNAENSIKLYQLVSHTSGVGGGTMGDKLYSQIPVKDKTLKDIAEFFSDKPLCYDPGTSQEYSTWAFDIAARVVEITSGMEFTEYVKVNILDKLGMNDTCYAPNDDQWNRMVDIHGRTEDGKSFWQKGVPGCVFASLPVSCPVTGGGMASTAEDYMKFAEMLLNEGKAPDGTELLSEESFKLFCTPMVSRDVMPGNQIWGLGVRIINDKHTLPVGSFGWSGAYGSHFWIDPVNKICAVYMKNSSYDGGAGCVTSVEFENNVMKSLK